MGTFLYYIHDEWTALHSMLIGCAGFGVKQHTGGAIRQQTVDDLAALGISFNNVHARCATRAATSKLRGEDCSEGNAQHTRWS